MNAASVNALRAVYLEAAVGNIAENGPLSDHLAGVKFFVALGRNPNSPVKTYVTCAKTAPHYFLNVCGSEISKLAEYEYRPETDKAVFVGLVPTEKTLASFRRTCEYINPEDDEPRVVAWCNIPDIAANSIARYSLFMRSQKQKNVYARLMLQVRYTPLPEKKHEIFIFTFDPHPPCLDVKRKNFDRYFGTDFDIYVTCTSGVEGSLLAEIYRSETNEGEDAVAKLLDIPKEIGWDYGASSKVLSVNLSELVRKELERRTGRAFPAAAPATEKPASPEPAKEAGPGR